MQIAEFLHSDSVVQSIVSLTSLLRGQLVILLFEILTKY